MTDFLGSNISSIFLILIKIYPVKSWIAILYFSIDFSFPLWKSLNERRYSYMPRDTHDLQSVFIRCSFNSLLSIIPKWLSMCQRDARHMRSTIFYWVSSAYRICHRHGVALRSDSKRTVESFVNFEHFTTRSDYDTTTIDKSK